MDIVQLTLVNWPVISIGHCTKSGIWQCIVSRFLKQTHLGEIKTFPFIFKRKGWGKGIFILTLRSKCFQYNLELPMPYRFTSHLDFITLAFKKHFHIIKIKHQLAFKKHIWISWVEFSAASYQKPILLTLRCLIVTARLLLGPC